MPRILHLTDIHLNFLTDFQNSNYLAFIAKMKAKPGDVVVVTGDIAEAPSVMHHMLKWKTQLDAAKIKFGFVLGNHDFYRGSIESTRRDMTEMLGEHWLPSVGIMEISLNTCLIGHDGFYDGLYADWFKSRLLMNDYMVIKELRLCKDGQTLFAKLNELSEEAASYIYSIGTEAAMGYKQVFIGTHVPPFREAATYQGKISDDTWMPHFSSKRMGDALLRLARENQDVSFTVLCGHTHGESVCHPAPNLVCYTGVAEYGKPGIANIFEDSGIPVLV